MATIIPADAKDKAMFLYHPTITGSKRIDLTKDGASAEIAALKREGWTEKRFAQCMYHPDGSAKLVTNPADMPALKKAGWQSEPIAVTQ